jgi:hypothetical protein
VISGEAGTFRESGLVRCDRNRRRSGLVEFLDEVQEFRKIVYKSNHRSKYMCAVDVCLFVCLCVLCFFVSLFV